ncbi:velvet factor-domain-containing protein [Gongronella butleri]|nr:velvet factor-domain-containing protein [Gongronella butleri]KAI8069535.1 velvet factor-domain-containing protein [Gongronella butleri]
MSVTMLSSYSAFQHRHTHSYQLKVLQQPSKARLCSFKEKVDRRPIDPPPIVQLYCSCLSLQPIFYLYATLTTDENMDINDHHGHSTTAGTVVQSLHKLKGLNNQEGGFFIFADISVRLEGTYRLKFTLFEIVENSHVQSLVSVMSDEFRVYSPKHFPGMSESTPLTKSFSEQGVYIRIRKDTRHASKRQRTETPQLPSRSMSPMVTSSDEGSSNGKVTAYDEHVGGANGTPAPSLQPPSRSKSIMSMHNLLIDPLQQHPHQHQPPPSSHPPSHGLSSHHYHPPLSLPPPHLAHPHPVAPSLSSAPAPSSSILLPRPWPDSS